jgi:hypothetical protein
VKLSVMWITLWASSGSLARRCCSTLSSTWGLGAF